MAWYCVQTRYGDEQKADESLDRSGHETYLPMRPVESWIGKRRKKYQDREPMFYCYLFVWRVDGEDGFQEILKNQYVTSIIRYLWYGEMRPMPAPQDLIDRIKEFEMSLDDTTKTNYEKGDIIRFKTGALKDHTGIIESLKGKSGKESAVVLLNAMGQEVRTQVKTRDIEPEN